MQTRLMYQHIWNQMWPEKPLILLAGPRQAGKTTLARDQIARSFPDSQYFNWDLPADKARLISDPAFFAGEPRRDLSSKPLVILDELHKYRNWKSKLNPYDLNSIPRFSDLSRSNSHFNVMRQGLRYQGESDKSVPKSMQHSRGIFF